MLRRIHVGLDGSPLAETVLDVVRTLALRLGAEVSLVHVTHVPDTFTGPESALDTVVAQDQVRARTYLEGAAAKIASEGLRVRTEVLWGNAAKQIVDYAEREAADLIVLATHGRSGMQRWLYGSVADWVLHATRTPLLLLRPAADRGVPAEIPRVVVPLDGSSLAEAALPTAEDLAHALRVPIALVRVVEIVGLAFAGDPFGGAYVDYTPMLDEMRTDAQQYLDSVAAALRRKDIAVEARAVIGLPVEAITGVAREEPGTLVTLTTHGRTGWRALVLGSVARRVVLLANGPVLVIRPPR
jgi:nucleotide-binding universal stress UspA family protein